MLRVQRITKSYGTKVVLKDASFDVRPGERVGLVGANGAGKSTLLDIIRGTLDADSGQVILSPGWTFGYLAQDNGLDPDQTVRQAMWSVFDDVMAAQAELSDIEHRLTTLDAADPLMMDLIHQQAELYETFDRLGGHTAEAEIGKVLHGLGFGDDQADRPVGAYSGGWQVRIALAKLLLGRADLLLLDEPTNHLDTDAVDWLEEYLTSRPRTVLIVSHDRYFLDRATTRTIELENCVITSYTGSYGKYVAEKQRRLEAQEAAAQRQAEFLADQRQTLERFRAKASKAAMVQSREKQLARIETIEPPPKSKPPKFKFAPVVEPGREVLRIRDVAKHYGDNEVLTDVDVRIDRGDRVAILGANGAGKSTLLRLVAKVETPDAGGVTYGHNVIPGYFAQNAAEVLDVNQRVFDALVAAAPKEWGDTDIRSVLGRFLFRGDDVFKKIRVLSGGERNRVALARLLVRPYNVLLLDEPTNHLDIPAREALQAALEAYPGTIVLVTHDRYLVDHLATRIVEIRDGTARVFDGDYAYYRRKVAEGPSAPEPVAVSVPAAALDAPQQGREVGKRVRRGAATVARSLAALEAELVEKEGRKVEVTAMLAEPDTYRDHELSAELIDELARLDAAIDSLLAQWSELAEEAG